MLSDFIAVELQFECLDVCFGVIFEMDQLFLNLSLHSSHVFFPIFGVEVKLVVVLADA